MKLGIMQPYFFPYIGYWQLMNAVDQYVIFDDVNYINRGYINRNAILINGISHNINLILLEASQNKHINQISIDRTPKMQKKLLRTLEMAYAKAPYYQDVMPMLQGIILQKEENLAKFLLFQIQKIAAYLKMDTKFLLSSELKKNCSLKGQEKILNICKTLNASEYYNAIGGQGLYDPDQFLQQGVKLFFLKTNPQITYAQFGKEFVPNLSIIDVIMFNSREEIADMLEEYTLL